ncbi:hypothetical protein KQX54_018693 [Cotesia glomerata]|uniref:Uncharacterized protein n=1 Tax=Cotesia glomerata TaxID=32391 RepID=A0AAV7I9I3_COTGL|nr:hypothetical protein KQX54_018693 [Cotesia glomerata]
MTNNLKNLSLSSNRIYFHNIESFLQSDQKPIVQDSTCRYNPFLHLRLRFLNRRNCEVTPVFMRFCCSFRHPQLLCEPLTPSHPFLLTLLASEVAAAVILLVEDSHRRG